MALAGRALFLGDKIKGAICLRRIAGDPGAPGELEHGSRGRPIDENNVRRLVPLLPQYPLPEWSINLLYPPHRHHPPSSGHIWTSARAIFRRSFKPAKSALPYERTDEILDRLAEKHGATVRDVTVAMRSIDDTLSDLLYDQERMLQHEIEDLSPV